MSGIPEGSIIANGRLGTALNTMTDTCEKRYLPATSFAADKMVSKKMATDQGNVCFYHMGKLKFPFFH